MTDLESEALVLSLIVSARALIFALPISIVLAYLLARVKGPGRVIVDALAYAPLIVPPVVVGYVLLQIFGLRGPVGSFLLEHFNIRIVFTSAGASLATAIMIMPMMIRAVRLSLEAQDPGLDEAARSLGATLWDRIISLHLPLAWPGIFAAGVLGFAAGLGEYGAVVTFVGNVQGETQTLPLAITSALQMPNGDAAAGRLALLSFSLAFTGLVISEVIAQWGKRRQ